MSSSPEALVTPGLSVEHLILTVRGHRVILDADIAALYGVETKVLNRAVKRNADRFPPDFMFQLSDKEFEALRCQSGTSRWGGRRYLPYAFTEHGALMLASVLNSTQAVQASLYVVRAFVRLRQFLATHKELAAKMVELERRVGKQDEAILKIVAALKKLMMLPAKPAKKVGFRHE